MVTYPLVILHAVSTLATQVHTSHSCVSPGGFSAVLVCNPNYLGYILWAFQDKGRWQVHASPVA